MAAGGSAAAAPAVVRLHLFLGQLRLPAADRPARSAPRRGCRRYSGRGRWRRRWPRAWASPCWPGPLPVPPSFPLLAVPALVACALQFMTCTVAARSGRIDRASPTNVRPRSCGIGESGRRPWPGCGCCWRSSPRWSRPGRGPRPAPERARAPMIEFSPARNFYLAGRARPLALLAPRPSLLAASPCW